MFLLKLISSLAIVLSFSTDAIAVAEATEQQSSDSGFFLRIQGQSQGFSKNNVFLSASYDKTQKNVWLGAGSHSNGSAVVFALRNNNLAIPGGIPPVALPRLVLGHPLILKPAEELDNNLAFNKTDGRLTHESTTGPGESYFELCPGPKKAPFKEVVFFGKATSGSYCTPIYIKKAPYHSS